MQIPLNTPKLGLIVAYPSHSAVSRVFYRSVWGPLTFVSKATAASV